MPTLWEILTKKKEAVVPMELQIFNPLELKAGNSLKIDSIDYESLLFTITSLREVRRTIDGKDHCFVDYEISARPLEGDPVSLRVRLVPTGNKNEFKVLLLKKIGECGYDKPFHEGLAYENNKGEFTEEGNTYWRVDDIQSEWVAKTKLLKDEDHDGIVEVNEVKAGDLTYWDFWRETQDEAQNTMLEFYFVEMDCNGYFEFWVGPEIDPARVLVY